MMFVVAHFIVIIIFLSLILYIYHQVFFFIYLFYFFFLFYVLFFFFFFFFSSRRRHTRSYGDWSSDVCSSDLDELPEVWRSEVSRLLPEIAIQQPEVPVPPPLDSPGAQSRFFEGLYQVLLSLCRGPDSMPGVILFDDVHWADSASLELLSYIVRRLREQPICLVFTWRGKQAMRDARLHQVLNEAQRSGKVTIIALTRLDQASVRELVRSVLVNGTELTAGLVDRLYGETEGLPFFLLEYLNAIAKGQLATGDGDVDWSLPGGVRDRLQSRLSGVS